MKALKITLGVALALALAIGCGGGGGGGGGNGGGLGSVVGRILDVRTGAAPNPQATVQTSAANGLTDSADGSFTVASSTGTTQVTVIGGVGIPVFTFETAPVNGTTDIGDLWVGPETVTVRGKVLDSTTSDPVIGATVSFAGRTATTNTNGVFQLQNVAYASSTQVAFWGIAGSAKATGYFLNEFSAAPNAAIGGVVDVNDILLTPVSNPDPPGVPYNIWGKISPAADAPGTVVTLKQGGSTVRIFNVPADGVYLFWVPPGTYKISYQKGPKTAPDATATLDKPNSVVRKDATLG